MKDGIEITDDEMTTLVGRSDREHILPLAYGSAVWLKLDDLPAAAWALRELMDMRGIKHDVDYTKIRMGLLDAIVPFIHEHYLKGTKREIITAEANELVEYLMGVITDEL